MPSTEVTIDPKTTTTPTRKAILTRPASQSATTTPVKWVLNRHNQLFGGLGKTGAAVKCQPELAVASEQEPSMVSNLMMHATIRLKRIASVRV